MLGFPKSTEFDRKIPKQKFYQNLDLSNQYEKQFSKEIDGIFWRNKISSETMNLSDGNAVKEIQVFEIKLKEPAISENILRIIDREIPYHLVYVLTYNNKGQLWISYKESSKSKENKFKVDVYYQTEWQVLSELKLQIKGLDLDKVYENFMFQIAGDKLQFVAVESIKEAVLQSKERDILNQKISVLEKKIFSEKQYNIQVKLMGELRALKHLLEQIK